ncbi:hypothetical protein MMC08_001393 [Hypocenomyce scalaris]|nr:hypothetical protein [Hypocenomyce scalaris]
MASIQVSSLQLYTYFRSTSSARIRIAAHLKNIPLGYVYVQVQKGEQLTEQYAVINPSLSVPTLSFNSTDIAGKSEEIFITQSAAILELFEELFPSSLPLLPPISNIVGRAHVRELVNIITCDVQPPTNQRILKRLRAYDISAEDWAKDWMEAGLRAFEQLATPQAGLYCYGDHISLADVVLAPALVNATRYGVDMAKFPTIERVNKALVRLEAFRQGDWRYQPDTPLEFRESGDS